MTTDVDVDLHSPDDDLLIALRILEGRLDLARSASNESDRSFDGIPLTNFTWARNQSNLAQIDYEFGFATHQFRFTRQDEDVPLETTVNAGIVRNTRVSLFEDGEQMIAALMHCKADVNDIGFVLEPVRILQKKTMGTWPELLSAAQRRAWEDVRAYLARVGRDGASTRTLGRGMVSSHQPTVEPAHDTCDVIKQMIRRDLAIMFTIPDKAEAERKRAELECAAEQHVAGRFPYLLFHHRKVRHAAMYWLAQHKDRIDHAMWSFHASRAERDQDTQEYADDIRRFIEELAESARQDCIKAQGESHAVPLAQSHTETVSREVPPALLRPPTSSESAQEFLGLLREWWAHVQLIRKGVRPWYNLGQFLSGFLLIPISFIVWMVAEIRCAVAPGKSDG
jgi:hypothetical protein